MGSKHKPDEGGARGCLGACGWVTLYNYYTGEGPGTAWRAGEAGFPSAQTLLGSEWISSVWVGAYCCVFFIPPPVLSLA